MRVLGALAEARRLKGWLLDTNIIASLTPPNGAPEVKAWIAAQDERMLHLSACVPADAHAPSAATTSPIRSEQRQDQIFLPSCATHLGG